MKRKRVVLVTGEMQMLKWYYTRSTGRGLVTQPLDQDALRREYGVGRQFAFAYYTPQGYEKVLP